MRNRLQALGKNIETVEEFLVLDLDDLCGAVSRVRKVLDSRNNLVSALGEQLQLHFRCETSVLEKLLESLLGRHETGNLGTIKAKERLLRGINPLLQIALYARIDMFREQTNVNVVGSRD